MAPTKVVGTVNDGASPVPSKHTSRKASLKPDDHDGNDLNMSSSHNVDDEEVSEKAASNEDHEMRDDSREDDSASKKNETSSDKNNEGSSGDRSKEAHGHS